MTRSSQDPAAEAPPVPRCVARTGEPGPAEGASAGPGGTMSPPPSERQAAGKPSPDTGTAGPAVLPAVPVRGRAQDPAGTGASPKSLRGNGAVPAGTRTYTIALPAGLALLSLNDRGHWAARYRRSEALKTAAWALALSQKIPHLDHAFIAAVYQPPPDWRERDGDNPVASVKAAIDGIVAAGILPSDACPRYVTGVYCTIGAPYPAGRLVLNLLPDDPVRELAALAGLRTGAA